MIQNRGTHQIEVQKYKMNLVLDAHLKVITLKW